MIDICQWRSCIGSWNCRRLSSYCNSCSTSIRSMLGAFTDGLLVLTLSLVLVFLSLLIISGDIELNPGPGQPPQLDDVYRLLKPHSIQWQDIGRELGVTKKPRMESLEEALKHTLSQWIESQCSEVSWDHLITVLVGLGMVCAAKEIREYLVIDAGAKEKYRWMEDIQNEVNKQHGKISEILQSFPEKHTKQPKGIIFIFGMTAGVIGVTKDVELVREMFEDYLQFAYHRVENMTCSELIIIIKAAVTYTSYPRFCKHICFYFAGHGGIDKNQQPFFKAGTSFNNEKDEVVYIEKDILSQFQCAGKKEQFVLFFDCCFNEIDSDYKVLSYDKLFEAPPHCFIACAAQKGCKAYGDKENGGRWTASLCKHIKEPIDLGEVLGRVNKEVMERSKVDASAELLFQSWFRSNIGPVCLLKDISPTAVQTPDLVSDVDSQSTNDICKVNPSPSKVKEPSKDESDGVERAAEELSTDESDGLELDEVILNASPKPKDVFDLLRNKTAKWDDIGRELGVPFDRRQGLLSQGVMSEPSSKLESVINIWVESECSPITWKNLLIVLCKLQFNDVIKSTVQFLKVS